MVIEPTVFRYLQLTNSEVESTWVSRLSILYDNYRMQVGLYGLHVYTNKRALIERVSHDGVNFIYIECRPMQGSILTRSVHFRLTKLMVCSIPGNYA